MRVLGRTQKREPKVIAVRLAITWFAALSTSAFANFVVTDNGPVASAGAVGDASNGVLTSTYGGANALFGSLEFSGTLTEVLTATFASEARWNIKNNTTTSSINYQPSTAGNFSGSLTISNTRGGLYWVNNGDEFRFEAFESFSDGAGTDANWTNVTFNFTDSVSPNGLGNFGLGTSFKFDTFGSGFDTELAVYSASGTLLGNNDDSGGIQSLLDVGALSAGNYFLVLGGFNSAFAMGLASAGNASGAYDINLNDSEVASGSLGSGLFSVYEFAVVPVAVVPEPATLALLSLGLAGLGFSRRKQ